MKSHLARVRLGLASSVGGLAIDRLIGVAIQDVGLAGLERISQQLSRLACQESIRVLEVIDASVGSPDEYIKRERRWEKEVNGVMAWSYWIRAAWAYKSLKPHQQNDQTVTSRILTTDRHRRHLLMKLAAHVYELEHGKRPSRAEDLVPSVLRAIPRDPKTGTNLVLNPAL